MESENDIRHRLTELAVRAERTGSFVYTDFLSMAQLSVFAKMGRQEIPTDSLVFGGCDNNDSCMIRFGDAIDETEGSPEDFPITILKVAPVQAKFADDLTHRDFLGSILGLGIEREKTGDILISDNTAYAFVHRDIADYIADNLEYVRHTHVSVSRVAELPADLRPRFEKRTVIVSSNRIDAIISKLYNLSREQSIRLITEARVFVNGAEISSNSKQLKEGDVVSVRGFGKWIFRGETGKTRKDRLCIAVDVYA